MNYKLQIGQRVKNKKGELGLIIEVDEQYIKVNFGTRIAPFRLDAFIKGFLVFMDTDLQKQVELDIEADKREKVRIEEEQREADRKEAEEWKKRVEKETGSKISRKKISGY